MPKDAIPAIPPVPAGMDPAQRQFLQAVKDAISVRAGQTKNRMDYSPTIRELVDMGMLTVDSNGKSRPAGEWPGSPPMSSGGGDPWDPNVIPGAPTGFLVLATPWIHFLRWDVPADNIFYYISHTEIWATTNNGVTPAVNDRDQAVFIASSSGFAYARSIQSEAEAYYWIRFATYVGNKGLWSSGRFEGAHALSEPDPETILRLLTDQITEGELYQDLRERIDYIDITDGGLVNNLVAEIADRLAGDESLSDRLTVLEQGTQSATTYRNTFEGDDYDEWQEGAGASIIPETGTVFLGTQSAVTRYSGSRPLPGTAGIYVQLPSQYAVIYSGLAVEFTLFVHPAGAPSARFAIAYALSDGRNSEWEVFATPSGNWLRVSVSWAVPVNTEGLDHYICILGDYDGGGGGIIVDEATTTLSLDLSGIATNADAIEALEARVTVTEDEIDAVATETTALKATVNHPTSGNLALATNVSSNTARITSSEGKISTLTSRTTAVETTVNNPTTGVIANANAINNTNSQVTLLNNKVTVNTSDITTLSGTVANHTNSIGANTTAISGHTNQLAQQGNSISAHTSSINALGARMTTAEGGINTNAVAIDLVEADVSSIDGEVNALASSHQQLQTTVGTHTTAISTHTSSINGIQGKYAVKIDTNGYVAGFGLISEPNAAGVQTSQFGVNADKFWIGHPAGLASGKLPFVVSNNKVSIDAAHIVDATITTAKLKTGIISSAYIANAQVVTAHIADGAITNAKIDNIINSTVYDFSKGIGWLIDKSGHIRASEFTLYDHTGQVILTSGKDGAKYFNRIDNNQQTFQTISGLPDGLDFTVMGMIPHGAFGNITMTTASLGSGVNSVTFKGNTLHRPDGVKLYDPFFNGTRTIVHATTAMGSLTNGFLVLSQTACNVRFSGWTAGQGTTNYVFVAVYNPVTNSLSAVDGANPATKFAYTPANTDCILGSFNILNPGASGTIRFYSLLATDIQMAANGNPVLAAGNLIIDGIFDGIRGDNYNFTHENWWRKDGDVTGVTLDNAPAIYLRPSNGTISGGYNGGWIFQPFGLKSTHSIKTIPGETLYFGVRLTHDKVCTGGNFVMQALYYDSSWNFISTTDVITVTASMSSASVYPVHQLYSGAAVTPSGAAYARVKAWNNRTTTQGGLVALRLLYAGRAPQEITPYTAATFIRNLAVNTLQLANQAVTFANPIVGGAVYIAESAPAPASPTKWLRAFLLQVNISEPGVPVMICFQLEDEGGTNGTAHKFVRLRRQGTADGGAETGTPTVLQEVLCYVYTGGSNFVQRGGHTRMWTDTGHGGGPCYYEVEVGASGAAGFHIKRSVGYSMELKK